MSKSHAPAGHGHGHHPGGPGHHNSKFVFGTPDDDVLDGSDRSKFFFGLGGGDTITAGAGNDKIFGGRGMT